MSALGALNILYSKPKERKWMKDKSEIVYE